MAREGETGAAGGDRRRRRRRCSGGAIMCTWRILGLAVVALLTLGGRACAYTNQWAAHIDGGERAAEQIAEDHGFRYLGKVSGSNFSYPYQRELREDLLPFCFVPLAEILREEKKRRFSRTISSEKSSSHPHDRGSRTCDSVLSG